MYYLYDITQGVIHKKVTQLLKDNYPFNNFVVKPVSRIFNNNVVYNAVSLERNFSLCIKVYLNSRNASHRFETEKKFVNEYFKEIHHMGGVKFVCIQEDEIYGLSIRKWIEGVSAMDSLLNNPEKFLEDDVNKIFHLMNKVWEYKEKSEPFQYLKYNNINSIYFSECYIEITVKKILAQCERLALKRISVVRLINDIKKEIFLAYRKNKLCDYTISIINRDPSLHEFFFCADKIIWIDWEYVSLGSKLVDIASFYYSMTNNFWADERTNKLLSKFFNNGNYIDDRNLFGLFLLEKVITCDEFTEYREPIEKLQWGLEMSMNFLR